MRRTTIALRFLLGITGVASTASAQTGVITTVAGGGPVDGAAIADAPTANARAVAVDGAGNIFVAARGRRKIYRIDTTGSVTTVVNATGARGSAGDGGPAVAAQLVDPHSISFDSAGRLYIADLQGARVRRVNPGTGLIETVAGNGIAAYAGDGGPAIAASLVGPSDVVVDAAGNLYIVDQGNRRIRKVDTAGLISTLAGDGTAGFGGDGGPAVAAKLNQPNKAAIDAAGTQLYIADMLNHRVRRVDLNTGVITTVAGNGTAGFSGDGGPAPAAGLNQPFDVALTPAGVLYVADTNNARIRRIDTGGTITTVAGNGSATYNVWGVPATSVGLFIPPNIDLDTGGNLYLLSRHYVHRIDGAGIIHMAGGNGTFFFGGDGGPATEANLDPVGVAVAADGSFFVNQANDHRIRKVDASGTITTYAGSGIRGTADGPRLGAQFDFPEGLALDGAENSLYVADAANAIVRKVDLASGTVATFAGTPDVAGFAGDGGPALGAQLNAPQNVVLDAAGNVYIADVGNNRVRRVDPSGVITTVAGTGATGPFADGILGRDANLNRPLWVALDATGNLYVAEFGGHRVRRVAAGADGVVTGDASASDEIITTVAGNGLAGFTGDGPATSARLFNPRAVAVHGTGTLYVADDSNGRVRQVDLAANVMTTIAGDGVWSYSGDGGPAASARVDNVGGLALDGAGNLYIADTGNGRVRKVVFNRPPVAAAGADASVVCTSAAGATLTLDASASYDPDPGDVLGYVWKDELDETVGTTPSVALALGFGTRTFTLTVTDSHGATASDTVDVSVRYGFEGFEPPLMADGSASITQGKAGRVIPVKFRLACGGQTITTAQATLSVFRVLDVGTGTLDVTDLTQDPGSSNDNGGSFRVAGDHYIYNLATRDFVAPATYRIFADVDDGSRHAVDFTLRP